LQYKKQLRLWASRRLTLRQAADAATVGLGVCYESSPQFSREYRHFFGVLG
jgi:AraC-like DNA-binding protein